MSVVGTGETDYAPLFEACHYFRDKQYPNRSVRDALRICYFNITIP